MPTAFPALDIYGPIVQEQVRNFEEKYLPNGALDEAEAGVKREYWRHGRRSLIRSLTESAISGSWGIGETQTDVGEFLGVDTSCLSDALRKGEMSADSLVALLFSEERPPSWPPKHVVDRMNRSGLIAACKHLASYVHDRPNLVIADFNELLYELLCEMLIDSRGWMSARCRGNAAASHAATEIVERVCGVGGREVIPSWYRKPEAVQAAADVELLRSNEVERLKRLVRLHDDWDDILAVATFTTTIGVRFTSDRREGMSGQVAS